MSGSRGSSGGGGGGGGGGGCLTLLSSFRSRPMSVAVFKITSISIVCLTACSVQQQGKLPHSWPLGRGMHRWPVPVMQNTFHYCHILSWRHYLWFTSSDMEIPTGRDLSQCTGILGHYSWLPWDSTENPHKAFDSTATEAHSPCPTNKVLDCRLKVISCYMP